MPRAAATRTHLDLTAGESGVTVVHVDCYSQGIVRIRRHKGELWRIWIEAERDRQHGVCLALVACRVLEPDGEAVIPRSRNFEIRESLDVRFGASATHRTTRVRIADLPTSAGDWRPTRRRIRP